MSHLLILGGSGFFGKSILKSYRLGSFTQFGIDKVSIVARNATNLSLSHPFLLSDSVRLINSDISKCRDLPFADIVIHAAASTNASSYELRPDIERDNLILGVENFCRLARKIYRDSKILFVSSGAIYGQYPSTIEFISEDYDVKSSAEESKQVYSSAKRYGERQILKLGSDGLNVSIARCFAFVGEYLPLDQHFAIGNFIQDGLSGRPIIVKANFPVFRSYMHESEMVMWLMKIAFAANNSSPIFNVGSDEAISIQNLGIKIANYFGVRAIIPPLEDKNINRYVPSIEKIKSELGLDLKINLNQAIEKTISQLQGK
jgi:dTDP-glucose 4,6-dehydratase